MNKYQRVMEHVKVDDEMKKRILQNVEKELASGADQARSVETSKVVPFKKRLGDGIKRYGTMVAMVAILLVGTAAVIRITGGVSNTSAPSMSDSAMEAPAAAEDACYESAETATEEAAEPAATESPYEEAAEAPVEEAEMAAEAPVEEAAEPASNEGITESPVYDSEATAEQAEEETVEPADSTQSTGSAQSQESSETSKPAEPAQPVGSAKTEGAGQESIESTQPSAVHYIGPVVVLIIVLAVIALIIWLIIYLIRKYRSRK